MLASAGLESSGCSRVAFREVAASASRRSRSSAKTCTPRSQSRSSSLTMRSLTPTSSRKCLRKISRARCTRHSAAGGPQGVAPTAPGVIVTDYHMPQIDGLEVHSTGFRARARCRVRPNFRSRSFLAAGANGPARRAQKPSAQAVWLAQTRQGNSAGLAGAPGRPAKPRRRQRAVTSVA